MIKTCSGIFYVKALKFQILVFYRKRGFTIFCLISDICGENYHESVLKW